MFSFDRAILTRLGRRLRHRRSALVKRPVRTFTVTSVLVLAGVACLDEPSVLGQDQPSTAGQATVRSVRTPGSMRFTVGGPQLAGPKVTPKEFDRMKKELALDEFQLDILDAAFEGYRQAIHDAGEPVRAEQTPMVINRGEGGKIDQQAMMERMRRMQELQREYKATTARIEKDFLTTVQDVLADDQARKWDAYERGMRRRLTLSDRAMLGGEGVDVVELVNALEIDPGHMKSVNLALNEYAVELDHALVDRNRILDEIDGSISAINPGTPQNMSDKLPDLVNKSTEKRLAVVRINGKFVSTISSLLDPETGAALRAAYNVASFPGIFRPTRADRYIDAIMDERESLTPAQLSSIDLITTDYRLNLQQFNRRLLEIERQRQADMFARISQTSDESGSSEHQAFAFQSNDGASTMMMNPHGNPETESQRRDAQSQKGELVDKTIESLYAALNEDQQAKLPKPEQRQFLSGADLAGLFGDQDFGSFGDLPPGLDQERLNEILRNALQNIQIDFGNGSMTLDGDVEVHTFAVPGAGEDGEGNVAVAITVSGSTDDQQSDAEGGAVDNSTKNKQENGGGGG